MRPVGRRPVRTPRRRLWRRGLVGRSFWKRGRRADDDRLPAEPCSHRRHEMAKETDGAGSPSTTSAGELLGERGPRLRGRRHTGVACPARVMTRRRAFAAALSSLRWNRRPMRDRRRAKATSRISRHRQHPRPLSRSVRRSWRRGSDLLPITRGRFVRSESGRSWKPTSRRCSTPARPGV